MQVRICYSQNQGHYGGHYVAPKCYGKKKIEN